MNTALACAKGTKDEPFYEALMLFMKRDYAGALPWLEKAVAQNPTNPKMHQSLANCLNRLGREDESIEQYAQSVALRETTAEVWLSVAWNRIERTAWKSAREVLLRAGRQTPRMRARPRTGASLANPIRQPAPMPTAACRSHSLKRRPARGRIRRHF